MESDECIDIIQTKFKTTGNCKMMNGECIYVKQLITCAGWLLRKMFLRGFQ